MQMMPPAGMFQPMYYQPMVGGSAGYLPTQPQQQQQHLNRQINGHQPHRGGVGKGQAGKQFKKKKKGSKSGAGGSKIHKWQQASPPPVHSMYPAQPGFAPMAQAQYHSGMY